MVTSNEVTDPVQAVEHALKWMAGPIDADDAAVGLGWAATSIAMSLIGIREIMGNAEYGDRPEKLP